MKPRNGTLGAGPAAGDTRSGKRLANLLKQELVLQHRVLAVAIQIREAIIQRDVVSLGLHQQTHRDLLREAEIVAVDRLALSREILLAAGEDAAEPTLSAVTECCPEETKEQILSLREDLIETAQGVQHAHLLNRQLLENELDYIGASLEVLARAAAPRRDYSLPIQRLGTPAIILDKAA